MMSVEIIKNKLRQASGAERNVIFVVELSGFFSFLIFFNIIRGVLRTLSSIQDGAIRFKI